jgi:hypothetical protein
MPSVAHVLPFVSVTADSPPARAASGRFTLDGDASLEAHLAHVCDHVRAGIERLVPASRLEGILLGGGYGRGEGGVIHEVDGDRPYNDLEFYVLLRGSTVLNEWRHRAALDELAHALSATAGIEVEFKIISNASLRRSSVTMFYYDLVCGHRRVAGPADLLAGCGHHHRATDIPLAEATRLLMNRCTGLLFARQRLDGESFSADDADFVERNLAKAGLALGDAMLVAFQEYHWSCRERARRLACLDPAFTLSWLEAVRTAHTKGVQFKLQPHRSNRTAVELEIDFAHLSQLACRVWLWLESRRLDAAFTSPVQYSQHPGPKCPGSSMVRNWLVNARRVRGRDLLTARGFRYPRERLLRALPVLLWQPDMLANPQTLCGLQRELRTSATSQSGLVLAYIRLWTFFR